MKTSYALGALMMFAPLAGAAWLGCSSSSSSTTNGTDAGPDQTSAPETGTRDTGASQDTGSAQDTGAPGDAGADSNVAVSCDDYCTTIMQACGSADGGVGGNAQYYDLASCKKTCALWSPGTYGETANSVGCRQYHAHAALQNPDMHCPHAGQGGGGVCGDRCEDYCFLVMNWCTVANGANPPYANNADCMSACAGYAYQADASDYDPNVLETLNCLDYHLRESLSDLADQGIDGGHCDDLSIDGGTVRGACHP